MAFTLTSSAFEDGAPIPVKYTGEGEDVSPPLAWSDAPPGTKSFVLVCDDPDAPSGTFGHWALWNIPADRGHLTEGEGNRESKSTARNDFGRPGYGGPMPPPGHGPHHYHFKLVALDRNDFGPPPDATVAEVWRMAKSAAIAVAELVGTYER